MAKAPGWYPDPTGLDFQRYWDGIGWTEQTAPAQGGLQPYSPTSPLPQLTPPPAPVRRRWFTRLAVVIPAAVLGLLIVIGVIGVILAPSDNKGSKNAPQGGATNPSTNARSSATGGASVSSIHPPSVSPTPRLTPVTSSPAAGTGSWLMPDEVGKPLQSAQDDLQRASHDSVFVSHSHDLLGDRFQILDRDWKVCVQNVPAGTRVAATGHIDFGVVKLDETCP